MSADILKDWTTEADLMVENTQRRVAHKAVGGPMQTVTKRGYRIRGRFDQLRRAAEARLREADDGNDQG